MDSYTKRAFTLPDAIAATACVAALGAISTAALSAASRADLTAQDQANLMTIAAASAAWSADHQGLIVGAPAASARELLNDPTALGDAEVSLFTDGLATQPFDWASPIAWGYLTDEPAPERRDIRLAYALGVEPVFVAPGAKEPPVADTPPTGPLSVLSDPAQTELSLPYFDGIMPNGIPDTYFAVQTATSYIAARQFLWWGQGGGLTPRWANSETFWGNDRAGVFRASPNWSTWWPGRTSNSVDTESPNAAARAYRPYVDRVGNPSRKIQLANGTRYQSPEVFSSDHDVNADASFGGAFADTGAWASDPSLPTASRAWPDALNASGQDMTRISFRHGDETTPRGNVLFFDGSVELMDIHDARDPSLWHPRGTSLNRNSIPEPFRSLLSEHLELQAGIHPFVDRVLIW